MAFSSALIRILSLCPTRRRRPGDGSSKSTSSTSSLTTISWSVSFLRKTMSYDRIRFSMIGHSSIIRAPSIRIDSAVMGTTLSRSYSMVVSCEK